MLAGIGLDPIDYSTALRLLFPSQGFSSQLAVDQGRACIPLMPSSCIATHLQEGSFSFDVILYNLFFVRLESRSFELPRLTMPSPTTSSTSATHVVASTPKISASSSSAHTPSANSSTHRLSNGAVAGIVIAVALGIALLTFLVTFFIMRRQQRSQGQRRYRSSEESELRSPKKQDQTTIPKKPLVTEVSEGPGTYENYLPQSADDSTVQQKTKAILDQLELHVENFYRKSSSSTPKIDNAELAVFDSPYLPASLASLLPRSKNRVNVIKHALAQFVTSSISPGSNPAQSLLPPEYALLPNTVTKAMSGVPTKAGEF